MPYALRSDGSNYTVPPVGLAVMHRGCGYAFRLPHHFTCTEDEITPSSLRLTRMDGTPLRKPTCENCGKICSTIIYQDSSWITR